jgi:hypothetical protein
MSIWAYFFCGAAAQFGPRQPCFEASRSHWIRHTHPVGLLWTSDQLVAEGTTFTTHNKRNRRTSMFWAGFEPAIPAIKRLPTYDLDRTASGIGFMWGYTCNISAVNIGSELLIISLSKTSLPLHKNRKYWRSRTWRLPVSWIEPDEEILWKKLRFHKTVKVYFTF